MRIVEVNFGTAFARLRHLAGELIEVAEVLLARKTELGRMEVTRRPGTGSSSKRDPKTKDVSGVYDNDTHSGSDDDEEHRQTTQKTRHPKYYHRDCLVLGCSHITFNWLSRKRMHQMSTEEIPCQWRDKQKRRMTGQWPGREDPLIRVMLRNPEVRLF